MVSSAAVPGTQVIDQTSGAASAPAVPSPPVPAAVASRRIHGVDVARGLAVLGMFAVHVGPDPHTGGAASVLAMANGRAAALFAVLAGVSIALLSGGPNPVRGRTAHRAAVRITVRAALLVPLGLLLTALGTDIEVILTFYGAYFLVALPALRLRTRTLATLAAVLAVLGPLASYALRSRFWPIDPSTGAEALGFSNFTSPHGMAVLFFVGAYPVITYMPFVFGGMAVGRLDLRRPEVVGQLLAVGAVSALVGYGGSWLALHPFGGLDRILDSVPASSQELSVDQLFDGLDGVVPTTDPAWLLTSAAHAGTPFWIAGAGGVALIVLGGCLLLTRGGGRTAVVPLAHLGALTLSVYSLQIIAIAVFGDGYDGSTAWLELVVLSGVMLLLATRWRQRWRRGPLETLLHVCSTKTAQAIAPETAAEDLRGGATVAPTDRQLTLRLLGAGGLVAIAMIHLLDLPSKLDETPYLGVLYILGPIATSLLAAALIVGSRRRIGWLLAIAIAAATAIGYCLSRITGLPDANGDIGNWGESLGVASLIAEGFVVLLTTGYLAITRRQATPYPAHPTGPPTTLTRGAPTNPDHR